LASFLPYQRDQNSTKVKLAMKIGGTYRLHEIDASRWKKWAKEADLSPDRVIGIVQLTVQEILKSINPVETAIREHHDSPFLRKLGDAIHHNAARCGAKMF
jgi:serine/threonine-protein kinase HipA